MLVFYKKIFLYYYYLFIQTFNTPDSPINLGNRILSISFVSDTVVVLRIPSVTLLARSKTPTTGLVTALI